MWPGWNPGINAICIEFFVSSLLCSIFFCILLAVFSTPPKPRFLNADSSILSMVDEEQPCGLLPLNRYLFIYWNRLHVLCLAPQWETSELLNLKWPMKNWEKKLYFFFLGNLDSIFSFPNDAMVWWKLGLWKNIFQWLKPPLSCLLFRKECLAAVVVANNYNKMSRNWVFLFLHLSHDLYEWYY